MAKLLGLDLGTKTLGIAISDQLERVSLAYENYTFPLNYYKKARERVLEICREQKITAIALGYPLNVDRSVGERALSAERFKKDLEDEGSPPVTLIDETYTTIAAYEELRALGYKRNQIKKKIDETAAKYILDAFMAQRSKDARK